MQNQAWSSWLERSGQWAARLQPQWVNLLLLAILAWWLGAWFWQVWSHWQPQKTLSPVVNTVPVASAVDWSAAASLFPAAGPAVVENTSFDVRLTAVIAGPRHGWVAVFAGSGLTRTAARENDSIMDGVVVREIQPDAVILRRQGRDERLTLPQPKQGEAVMPNGAGRVVMPVSPGGTARNEGTGLVVTTPGVNMGAAPAPGVMGLPPTLHVTRKAWVQVFKQLGLDWGQGWQVHAQGLQVGPQTPAVLVQLLALQQGDVVLRVDGQPLKNPSDAMQIYQVTQKNSRFQLDVLRQGRELPTQYNIDP